MATEVDVANRTLQILGASRINSITENTRNAISCRTAIYVVRDRLFEDHPWSFTAKRIQLAAAATPPIFTMQNYFNLPADFIRLLPPDPLDNYCPVDWQIEGNQICTNDGAPLNLRYGARITDVTIMPALFREAWAAELAAELAEELTQSNDKKAAAEAKAKSIIARAKKSNAIQRPAGKPPEDLFVAARR